MFYTFSLTEEQQMKRENLRGGVLKMEHVREALRLHELGFSQRDIHRHLKISRSCIQRYLLACKSIGVTYQDIKEVGDQALKERLGIGKLGRQAKKVMDPDFAKIREELSNRKGTTLELLWLEWTGKVDNSYGYSHFCQKYRAWAKAQKVWMRQEYRGGEKCLVDYSGEVLEYSDETTGRLRRAEIFVGVLGASNKIYIQATASQQLLDFQQSHVSMFEYFRGVPEVVIVDNLKSAVTKSDRYEPVINRVYQEIADHYGIAVLPARARKPQDKGKVEQAVQLVERRILAPLRHQRFKSIAEINEAIRPLLESVNGRVMKEYGLSRSELFERADKPFLKALPAHTYIPQMWVVAKVGMDYHIQFKKHNYSVPYYLCRKEVWVRGTSKLLEIFHENQLVATHVRSNVEFANTTNDQHMPSHHLAHKSRSTKNFIEWATAVGPETLYLTRKLFEIGKHEEQGFRSALGLQRLGVRYGAAELESAAEVANSKNIISQRFVRVTLEQRVAEKNKNKAIKTHENIRGGDYFH
jgi:transposase